MVKVTKHKKQNFPYSNVHGAFGILKVNKKIWDIWDMIFSVKEKRPRKQRLRHIIIETQITWEVAKEGI